MKKVRLPEITPDESVNHFKFIVVQVSLRLGGELLKCFESYRECFRDILQHESYRVAIGGSQRTAFAIPAYTCFVSKNKEFY